MSFSHYQSDERLSDGTSRRVRSVRPEDRELLIDLFNRLSPRSVYFRFFRAKQRLSEADLAQLTEVDFRHHAALAALLPGPPDDIVGVARFSEAGPQQQHRKVAEVNFLVADKHQGRGIGKLLLRHMAVIASGCGITEFEAWVLPENGRMLKMFAGSGFPATQKFEDGVVHVTFPITEAGQSRPGA
jgi:GNAT superfamily N-acetyltransferase